MNLENLCVELYSVLRNALAQANMAFTGDSVTSHNPSGIGADTNPNTYGSSSIDMSKIIIWAVLGILVISLFSQTTRSLRAGTTKSI